MAGRAGPVLDHFLGDLDRLGIGPAQCCTALFAVEFGGRRSVAAHYFRDAARVSAITSGQGDPGVIVLEYRQYPVRRRMREFPVGFRRFEVQSVAGLAVGLESDRLHGVTASIRAVTTGAVEDPFTRWALYPIRGQMDVVREAQPVVLAQRLVAADPAPVKRFVSVRRRRDDANPELGMR